MTCITHFQLQFGAYLINYKAIYTPRLPATEFESTTI